MGKHSIHYGANGIAFQRARALRRKSTPAEKRLWQALRNRRLADFKFRRQHPIGPFIVDFFCNPAELVIEVDGDVHDIPEVMEYDLRREKCLKNLGLKILRFRNEEVMVNLSAVLEEIVRCLQANSSSPRPSPGEREHLEDLTLFIRAYRFKGFEFLFLCMMKIYMTIISLLILFSACAQKRETPVETMKADTTKAVSHKNDSAFKYVETFKGTLLCADCPGIVTEITIINDNLTYRETDTYLERNVSNKLTGSSNTERGYKKNEAATVYVLDDDKPGHERRFLKLNDTTILVLDGNSEIIDTTSFYKLYKIK